MAGEMSALSNPWFSRATVLLLTGLLVVGITACDSITTRPTPQPPTAAVPAIDVSIGGSETCSVRVDGRIVCWRQGSDGLHAKRPIGAEFQSISVGEGHACAIRNNGSLTCWNRDSTTTDLPGGPFTEVSSGRFHACALQASGAVECWRAEGSNALPSEVGQADPPAGSGPFRSVSAGDFHTCAVQTDGAALCWGDNEFSQSSPPDGEFHSVSAGSRHTCGVRIDGSVACWGSNEAHGLYAERTPGSPPRPTTTPLPDQEEEQKLRELGLLPAQWTPPVGPFQSVSAGYDHTCGIRNDGSIACWGSPRRWHGAHPISARQATPPAGYFRSVSAGISHTCAVRQDGVVICWGYNEDWQNNPPGYIAMSSNGADYLCEQTAGGGLCWNKNIAADPDLPPDIPAPTHYTAIIAGALHTCALTDYAAIACWGQTDTPHEGAFRSIAHGCGVRANGAVDCWRSDHLEHHVTPPSGEFTAVSGGQTYHGRHHFCAISAARSVHCWGYGFDNPIPSPSGSFRQISVHGNNACGIRPDDSLDCWWFSFGGISEPVPEGRFQSVSVGHTHACAIRDNGRVACWGYDGNGRASPPRSKFKSVSVGSSHSCGVKTDDTLACWGSNTARFSPGSLFGRSRSYYETRYGQAEPPEGTFLAVAAGEWHTCGIRTDGRANCWGANNYARNYTLWNNNHYYGQATPPAGNP